MGENMHKSVDSYFQQPETPYYISDSMRIGVGRTAGQTFWFTHAIKVFPERHGMGNE